MKLLVLSAKDSKDMEKISEELSEKKFRVREKQDNFILMHKKRYGNPIIHAVCLIIALGFLSIALFVNVVYFTYSYLFASPNVLITTETVDDEGNPLEFDSMDDVLNKANSIL